VDVIEVIDQRHQNEERAAEAELRPLLGNGGQWWLDVGSGLQLINVG